MCNAYFIFVALVVGVMIWDMWGVKEGNQGDVFFEKWNKCCETRDGSCRQSYRHMKRDDRKRVRKICRRLRETKRAPTPQADYLRKDAVRKSWEAL